VRRALNVRKAACVVHDNTMSTWVFSAGNTTTVVTRLISLGLASVTCCVVVLGIASFFVPVWWCAPSWPQPPSHQVSITDGVLVANWRGRISSSSFRDAVISIHALGASCNLRWGQQVGVWMHDQTGKPVNPRLLSMLDGRIPLWMLFVLAASFPSAVWAPRQMRWCMWAGALALPMVAAVRVMIFVPELGAEHQWAIGAHLHTESAVVRNFDLVARGWFVPATLVAIPALGYLGHWFRRDLRRRKGLCERCGYDLTGNVSGMCPECGRTTNGQLSPEDATE